MPRCGLGDAEIRRGRKSIGTARGGHARDSVAYSAEDVTLAVSAAGASLSSITLSATGV